MNTIATPTWISREVLRVASNETKFCGNITKKLSDDFMVGGTKVGATVNVRLPQQFTTSKGQAFQQQGISDVFVPITITDQAHVDTGFSSQELTLEVQDARERYVNPAATQIANTIDVDGLDRCTSDVFNAQGTPGTVPNANSVYFNAAATLTAQAVPQKPRNIFINSIMRAVIANANTTLFNPQNQITELWKTGQFMSPALSWDAWFEDVNLFVHTVGPLGGTPLVNGASQVGSSLVTDGWTAAAANRLKRRDHFTVAGVFAVNPQSRKSTTQLQVFLVTADVASDGSGNATIPIYPPIITSGAYQTVTASPADNAAITVIGAASTVTPFGVGCHPEAFVMASADLVMPRQGVARRVRMPGVGMSCRYWESSDIMTDQHPSRLDVIYGFKAQRPEFATLILS